MSGCFCTGICKVPPYIRNGKVVSVTITGTSSYVFGLPIENPAINKLQDQINAIEKSLENLYSLINKLSLDIGLQKEIINAESLSNKETNENQYDGIEKCFEKIEKLEDKVGQFDLEKLERILFEGLQTHASILRCESKTKELEEKMEDVESELVVLMVEDKMIFKKKPHKCPICNGNGNIYIDLLSVEMELNGWKRDAMGCGYKSCHSCEGKGIVWG